MAQPVPSKPSFLSTAPPKVALIGAAAFACAARAMDSKAYILQLGVFEQHLASLAAASAAPSSSAALQLSEAEQLEQLRQSVPPDYHQFLDVFLKSSADKLPPHSSFDHKIELEDGK